MKRKADTSWSPEKSEELYGFRRWGNPHFSVDAEGQVTVDPLADDRRIRIVDVVDEARTMGIQAPLVIRFQDLLHHRVVELNRAVAVSQAAAGVQEVNENINHVSAATGEVAQDIIEVSSSSQQISKGSKKISSRASDLGKLSEKLIQLVDQFQI